MSFTLDERNALLTIKGVGKMVIARLEEMGFHTLQQLATANAEDIVSLAAKITRSTCWKNSPQALAAIGSAIKLAQSKTQ